MAQVLAGQKYPMRLLIPDGSAGLFPVARVYNALGAFVWQEPLVHLAMGLYGADWNDTGSKSRSTIVYLVYTDAGHTLESTTYERSGEELDVVGSPAESVWGDFLEDYLVEGTFGEAISLQLGLAQQNFVLDETVYNSKGLLLSGRVRLFPTAADAEAGTNVLATYLATSTANAAPLAATAATYRMVRV